MDRDIVSAISFPSAIQLSEFSNVQTLLVEQETQVRVRRMTREAKGRYPVVGGERPQRYDDDLCVARTVGGFCATYKRVC